MVQHGSIGHTVHFTHQLGGECVLFLAVVLCCLLCIALVSHCHQCIKGVHVLFTLGYPSHNVILLLFAQDTCFIRT